MLRITWMMVGRCRLNQCSLDGWFTALYWLVCSLDGWCTALYGLVFSLEGWCTALYWLVFGLVDWFSAFRLVTVLVAGSRYAS